MNKKTASFKKTETNHVTWFLENCIKHKILTVKKAQAINKALEFHTVEQLFIEVYETGSIWIEYFRTNKTTGEMMGYHGFMKKQNTTVQLVLSE